METKLLILGKGDNIITMILDNLYSINRRMPDIHIYNNLGLPIINTFTHDGFNIEVFDVATGTKVASQPNLTAGSRITLGQLSGGTYIIRVTSNDQKILQQFKVVKM